MVAYTLREKSPFKDLNLPKKKEYTQRKLQKLQTISSLL